MTFAARIPKGTEHADNAHWRDANFVIIIIIIICVHIKPAQNCEGAMSEGYLWANASWSFTFLLVDDRKEGEEGFDSRSVNVSVFTISRSNNSCETYA